MNLRVFPIPRCFGQNKFKNFPSNINKIKYLKKIVHGKTVYEERH